MTVHKPVDTTLKKKLMAEALKDLAETRGGVNPNDSEACLTWCTKVGLIAPHPERRGHVILTERGVATLWLYMLLVRDGISKRAAARRAIKRVPR